LRTAKKATEWALVLSRLDGLEVSDTTKAIFQRFVNGEPTIKELSTAIDEYISLKGKSVLPSGNVDRA
jgi:antitoxin VbhA-like protein